MTTPRAQNEIEFGKFLASQGAENVWNWGSPAGRQRALKRANKVIEAAKLAPGVTALELGCGTGLFTHLFAETGAVIHANDISAELLEIAAKQNPGVKFIHSRFEDIPASTQYDAIIGSSVLHHLEIAPSLAKSYELLKPGGVLAFAEPNLLNPQVFAERTFLRNVLSSVSPDETAFLRWQLAKQLRTFGFVDVDITPFDWLHPAIPKPLIRTTEAIGRILEALPLVREFSGSLLIRAVKA